MRALPLIAVVGLAAPFLGAAFAGEHEAVEQHVMIYHEEDHYGGWPANHGIWAWDNEILVGFGRGHYKDLGDRHHLDRDLPEQHWLARSTDGGETWTLSDPSGQGVFVPQGGPLLAQPVPGLEIPPAKEFEGRIDFAHPDFAFATRMYSTVDGETQFFYSYDRGRTWEGPYRLPLDIPMSARTNYIVNGPDDCMVFLTGDGAPGEDNGTHAFMARTRDGGQTWTVESWISSGVRGIMPSAARVSENEIFAAARRRDGDRAWISGHVSEDDGQTWTEVEDPADDLGVGNPPMVLRLRDGRLCITYGDRRHYRIAARISEDGGRSWGPEIILRDGGGNHDLGYTRTVQRADGKAVTIYYFWDEETGPERHIAATIWDPEAIE